MGEANAPVVELDYLAGNSRLERAPRVSPRRCQDDPERRVCERGGEEQHLACPVGKLRDPCADEIVKTFRNDDACARRRSVESSGTTRTSSSANSGLPPDVAWISRSVGGERIRPRREWIR